MNKKIKIFLVKEYTDLTPLIESYTKKYPQYKFEGSSSTMNSDGTITTKARFIKQ